MLRLPASRVRAALAAGWPGWLRPQATDAQLASALRIPLPSAPPASPPPGVNVADAGPPSPVCR
jgi:hypothetical protein